MAVTGTLIKANAAALYDEINNGATLTNTTIAANDLIGIADVSAGTGAKITINNLISFILNNYSILNSIRSYAVVAVPDSMGAGDTSPNIHRITESISFTDNVANAKLIVLLDAEKLEQDRYGYVVFITKTKIIRGFLRNGNGNYVTTTRTANATTIIQGESGLLGGSRSDDIFWGGGSITYTGAQLIFKGKPTALSNTTQVFIFD